MRTPPARPAGQARAPARPLPPGAPARRGRLRRRYGWPTTSAWTAPVAVKRVPLDDGDRPSAPSARRRPPRAWAIRRSSRCTRPARDEEACYLVSEFVRGATFGSCCARARCRTATSLGIGAALCEALAHAHARGVVHRDVKPGNIMVPPSAASGAPAPRRSATSASPASPAARPSPGPATSSARSRTWRPSRREGERVTARGRHVRARARALRGAQRRQPDPRRRAPAETARKVGTPLPALARLRRDLPPSLCTAIDAAVAVRPQERSSLSRLRAALVAVRDEVDDEPGIVEGSPVDELSTRWTAVQRRYRDPGASGWLRARREALTRVGAADPAAVEEDEPEWIPGAPPAGHAPVPADAVPAAAPGRRMLGRAFAAGAAAALAGVALHSLADAPPVTPAAGAAVAPASSCSCRAWAGCSRPGRSRCGCWRRASPGTAVVLAIGLIPVPLALPLAGTLWSVPGGGPVLGALGPRRRVSGVRRPGAPPRHAARRSARSGCCGCSWPSWSRATGCSAGPPDGVRPRVRWAGVRRRRLRPRHRAHVHVGRARRRGALGAGRRPAALGRARARRGAGPRRRRGVVDRARAWRRRRCSTASRARAAGSMRAV